MSNELKPLNKAQQVFVSEYLKCFNGTEAYSRAYPKAKRDSARANAADLLANTSVKAEIEARLAEIHMSADEALKLMADIARGDIGDFVNDFGGVDIGQARKLGKTRLIKKVKTKTITVNGNGKNEDKEIVEEEIELYPADSAIRDILKIHGKFKDSFELPETLKIQIVKASDATTSNQ